MSQKIECQNPSCEYEWKKGSLPDPFNEICPQCKELVTTEE